MGKIFNYVFKCLPRLRRGAAGTTHPGQAGAGGRCERVVADRGEAGARRRGQRVGARSPPTVVHSRLVMGKSSARNIDGEAKLITIHPSSSAALLDVNIPSQLTRKAQALGHMHFRKQDFWGAFFNFKPHKEAIVGQRDKITPPTMGDNYTFWGVTLYSITVKRGPGVRGEVWLPVARWRTVASNAMRSPAASPRTTSSGQQSKANAAAVGLPTPC